MKTTSYLVTASFFYLLCISLSGNILLQAFGVPSIFTHTKKKPTLFFGSDRFHLIAQDIGQTWKGPEPNAAPAKL